jgi:hypothetical protein
MPADRGRRVDLDARLVQIRDRRHLHSSSNGRGEPISVASERLVSPSAYRGPDRGLPTRSSGARRLGRTPPAGRRAPRQENRGPSRPGSHRRAAGSGSPPASSEGAPPGRFVASFGHVQYTTTSRSRGILATACSSSLGSMCTAPGIPAGSACISIRCRRSTTNTDSSRSSLAFSSSGVIRAMRSCRRNRCRRRDTCSRS